MDLVEALPGTPPDAQATVARPRVGIGTWLAAGWLVVLVGATVLAPVLPLRDPDVSNAAIARTGPSAAAWLGGDANGRDVFARVVFGARASLLIGLGSIAIGTAVGGFLGLIAGYYRRRIDAVIASVFDVMLSVPAIVLALAFTVFLGPSVRNMVIALGVVAVPQLGRIVRASTLSWSEREFVTAARSVGARDGRIIVREVAPNVLPALFAVALLGVGVAIVAEGGLSLLGAGVQAGTITWGTMIVGGVNELVTAPSVVLSPATAMFLTVLALNYLGDVVRSRLDVRESVL